MKLLIEILFLISTILCFPSKGQSQYSVLSYPETYEALETYTSMQKELLGRPNWSYRFELDFAFPFFDTTFNYIYGNYESIYGFDDEIEYSILLLTFGYEYDQVFDTINIPSDVRFALKKTKSGKKALVVQYTKMRLTSDPSIEAFDSYINLQLWFIENGDIEVRFGDYDLSNSPVYVVGEGFYLQTNVGPILIGPELKLQHPYKENQIIGAEGKFDSLQTLDRSGTLKYLPPPNWVIKLSKDPSSTTDESALSNVVFPNPIMDKITFTKPVKNAYIYTLDGRCIKSFLSNGKTSLQDLDVSALQAGLYILKLQINQYMTTQKIIKI